MIELIKSFADTGIVGTVATLAIWWAYRERLENRKQYERMVAMTQQTTERYHTAMKELSRTVNALSNITRDLE